MTIKVTNIELFISELFSKTKDEFPYLHDYLLKNSPLKVVDIGCRVPINLFFLYHMYDCELLKGVDEVSEEDCVQAFKEDIIDKLTIEEVKEDVKSANNFFNIYSSLINVLEGEKSKITNEVKFNEIFVKPFIKLKIYPFLTLETEKYDLIIISNLLHLFETFEVELLLPLIKKILNKNGILLIRVQDKGEKSLFDYIRFRASLQKLFPNGEMHEYYIENKWAHSIYINIPNLIEKQPTYNTA